MSTQWPPKSATELRNQIIELEADREAAFERIEAKDARIALLEDKLSVKHSIVHLADAAIAELEAENEQLRSDLEAEARDADSAVDSVVAKVKWYHAELEEKDVTIKALRFLLAWKPRAQREELS